MHRILIAAAAAALVASSVAIHRSTTPRPTAHSRTAPGISKGPYLMNPTTNGITVCWVSDSQAPGTVEYGLETASEPEYTGKSVEAKPARYHRVRISGLKAYTRYSYRVACQGHYAMGAFVTAAPPNQPFKFVAYGDNRTQPLVHAAVLRQMALFDPDFIIQSGDQVADGSSETDWDEFWQVAGKMLNHTPYYPTLGNHEGRAAPYFHYFDVPREYSFDYGNAHFVALDSNRLTSENGAQESWLKKDLAANQQATWRIVFFHHTVHTCVDIPSRRALSKLLAARLEPIFKAEHVQLVINGHDHNYQHHIANGIHYIVSGGGGAPLYDLTPNTPFVKVARKAHHECEITVNGPVMSIRAVEANGSVIDQFQVNAAIEHALH